MTPPPERRLRDHGTAARLGGRPLGHPFSVAETARRDAHGRGRPYVAIGRDRVSHDLTIAGITAEGIFDPPAGRGA